MKVKKILKLIAPSLISLFENSCGPKVKIGNAFDIIQTQVCFYKEELSI